MATYWKTIQTLLKDYFLYRIFSICTFILYPIYRVFVSDVSIFSIDILIIGITALIIFATTFIERTKKYTYSLLMPMIYGLVSIATYNAYRSDYNTLNVLALITCNIGVSILFKSYRHLLYYIIYSFLIINTTCLLALGIDTYSLTMLGFFLMMAFIGYIILSAKINAETQLKHNKLIENALRESKELYRTLVEHNRDLVYTHDLDGKILSVNNSVKTILGYEKREIIGKNVLNLILPQYSDEFTQYIEKLTNTGKAEGYSQLISKNGEIIILEYRNLLNINEEGDKMVVCSSRDVTNQLRAEKALKKSESKFRHIFNSLHDPYYSTDMDGLIKIISPAAHSAFGYTPNELIGQNITKLYATPSDRKKFIAQILKDGFYRNFETSIKNKDGDILNVSVSSFLVYNLAGVPIGIEGTIRDITESKKVELELKESEERYRDLVENSIDMICTHDEKGILLTVNPTFEKVLGYSKDYFIGKNIKDFIVEKHQDDFDKYLMEILEKGHSKGHMQVRDSNNVEKILEYNNSLRLDDPNKIVIRGMTRDVTKKIMIEKALTLSEKNYRNIFNSIPDILYRTNLNGNFTLVSPAVKKVLGYEPQELIGKNALSIYQNPNIRERFIKRLNEQGYINNFENIVIKKDGTTIHTSANSYYIYDDVGNPVAIEGLIRDISESKQIEKMLIDATNLAVEASKAKTEFIANVSHELRTPLNGILGLTHLLRKTSLNKLQFDRVETIEQSTQILSRIINDLLELSKLDAKKVKLKPTEFNLEKVLDKMLKTFSSECINKNITIAYSLSQGVPQTMIADNLRIQQILNDLVSNAIKFTDKGGIVVKVKKIDDDLRKDSIRLKFNIIDTGIGIAEKNIGKLFKRFSQVEGSSSRKYQGTGLGLAICKDLVTLIGGKIGVNSSPGEGSDFWFTVIVKKPKNGNSKKTVKKKVEQPPINKKILKLLLIEDNVINRTVTQAVLQDYGYIVEVAEGGREGVDKIIQSKYDLILLDHQMPDMNGEKVLIELKKINRLDGTPVVILSANALEENKEKMFSQGAAAYYTKPLNYEELDNQIQQIIINNNTNNVKSINRKYKNELINIDIINYLNTLPDLNVKNLIKEFTHRNRNTIKAMESLIADENYDKLNNKVHTLKGSANALGLTSIANSAGFIMKKITEKKYDLIKPEVEKLKKYNHQIFKNNDIIRY